MTSELSLTTQGHNKNKRLNTIKHALLASYGLNLKMDSLSLNNNKVQLQGSLGFVSFRAVEANP